jgi:hypothetical protein
MPVWKLEITFEAPHDIAMQTSAWVEAELIQALQERGQQPTVNTAIYPMQRPPVLAELDTSLGKIPAPPRPVPFQASDKVRCRNNAEEEETLTIGKQYEVLAIDQAQGEVQVLDDQNIKTYYDSSRFELV